MKLSLEILFEKKETRSTRSGSLSRYRFALSLRSSAAYLLRLGRPFANLIRRLMTFRLLSLVSVFDLLRRLAERWRAHRS